MKAAGLRVSDYKTVAELENVLERIESDYANYVGGEKAFFSGKQTHYTAGAQKVVDRLNKKLNEMLVGDDEEEGM